MISQRQLRANSRNAQQSTGPRTPEGKLRSARNALTHGLTAKDFAVTSEEKPLLDAILDSYIDHFDPQDPIEADLIEELAITKMRQKRSWRLEASEINIEVGRQLENVEAQFPGASQIDRVALAVEWLADNGRTLEYLRRYEGQFRRAWHHCLEKLEARRKNLQNEPIPITEHSIGARDATKTQRKRAKNHLPPSSSTEGPSHRGTPGGSLPPGADRPRPKDAVAPDE